MLPATPQNIALSHGGMNGNNNIKLYTLSTCIHCKALRDFFLERKLSFEYVDVDLLQGPERQNILQEVRKVNARCSFPTTVIGDRVVVGFKEDALQEVLDSLRRERREP